MRVLGVDPGTIRTGWGVVDVERGALIHVAHGVVSAGRGELTGRMASIYSNLSELVAAHGPESVGLERNFLARNVQSAFRLGEARGVVMAVVGMAGLQISEYTPMTVKKAVAGYGRADKGQVQAAVCTTLRLAEEPLEDAADALAVAICHGLSVRYNAKIEAAKGLRVRRSVRVVRGGGGPT